MRPILVHVLVSLTVIASLAGCSRQVDDSPPVATPTVTLDRSEVATGSPVDFTYKFAIAPNAQPFTEDYWVFVHFLDVDGELIWTDDHDPATPTTMWKAGETVSYTRTMFVPKSPHAGETRVVIGLFSRKTGDRLPLIGQGAGMRSYRVSTFTVRPQADNLFVVFRDGWYDTEVGDEGSGVEWQWSKREGMLSFRNPKREVILFLQADQPAQLSEPQHVQVRVGPTAVDTFALPPGKRELRRIPITADQLGTGDAVELTIAVDKTFVPASISQLNSQDPRELGIRVFRAYVQPK